MVDRDLVLAKVETLERVHEYRKLDPSIVDSIVRDRLGDLRSFARIILQRFRI